MTLPAWLTYLDVLHDMDICIQCEVQIDGGNTIHVPEETNHEFLGETFRAQLIVCQMQMAIPDLQ